MVWLAALDTAVSDNTCPLVSVLMPVYNGMPYLPLAIESLRNQTYTHFELLVVNDCSTDATRKYLDSLTDTRVRVIHLPRNLGVTGALQTGLQAVRGAFIARLDADDRAYPQRLQRQVKFMKENPFVGLLASTADAINERGDLISYATTRQKSELELRWELLFKNPIIHSTVMMRTEVLNSHHLNYSKPHAEDYDLWVRMAAITRIHQMPEALVQYRVNTNSWTYTKLNEQNEGGNEVSNYAIKQLLDIPDDSISRIRTWVRFGGRLGAYDRRHFMHLVKAFVKRYPERNPIFSSRLANLLRKRMSWRVWLNPLFWKFKWGGSML